MNPAGCVTVSTKFWFVVAMPFPAWNVSEYRPPVPAAGEPESVAVPLPV